MTLRKAMFLLMLVMAASAWLTYLDRPTQGNLRRAIRNTFPLL
ncbi:MAG: hypothetical protein M0Z49_03535 [Chloroflexi bacterium]|nr:hypothetical protein [Chloroflexota bacterium]